MQKIDLDLDKENELVFRLAIEGTKPASPKSRFMLEADDFSLSFPAHRHSGGEVTILIPSLQNILKEGAYSGTLEVIIDERVFTPIKIDTNFKKSVSVVAEAVVPKKKETQVSVSSVVAVSKSAPHTSPASSSSPRQEEKNKIVSESARSSHPPQRKRSRPPQNLRRRNHDENTVLESKISGLARKKGITLSRDQVRQIIKKYKTANN